MSTVRGKIQVETQGTFYLAMRTLNELNQTEVGRILGIEKAQVSHLERNRRSPLSEVQEDRLMRELALGAPGRDKAPKYLIGLLRATLDFDWPLDKHKGLGVFGRREYATTVAGTLRDLVPPGALPLSTFAVPVWSSYLRRVADARNARDWYVVDEGPDPGDQIAVFIRSVRRGIATIGLEGASVAP